MKGLLTSTPAPALLISQRFYRIEACGEIGGNEGRNRADQKAAHANNQHISRHNFGRNFSKLVYGSRKKFDVKRCSQKIAELISVLDQSDTAAKTDQSPEKSNDHALGQENPHDLIHLCSKRFHDPDLARFLNCRRDEGAHDAESSNDHYENQNKKHGRSFDADRLKELTVVIHPGVRLDRRLQKLIESLFHL